MLSLKFIRQKKYYPQMNANKRIINRFSHLRFLRSFADE